MKVVSEVESGLLDSELYLQEQYMLRFSGQQTDKL